MNKNINLDEIKEKLIEFKGDQITQSSLNIYIKNICKFIKDLDFKKYRDFKKEKEIKEYLENYKMLTRRNYLNSLIIFLQAFKFKEDYIKVYQNLRDEYNEEYKKNAGEKSITENENWIELDEIKKYLSDKEKIVEKTKDPKLFMDYLIMYLQINYPMRNELQSLIMISDKDYKNLDEDELKKNYIVFKPQGIFISLGNYKTQKKYGIRKFDIEKGKDEQLIRMWKNKFHRNKKLNEKDNLIYNIDTNNNFNTNTYSKYLINLFETVFNRKVGSRMIRHIVMTDKFGANKEELKKMANIAGNSPSTINNIYVKSE
tara:strand:+ start:325 stop:1269 length:945 start_codon:yes stop_codon:yes gene_type:complete